MAIGYSFSPTTDNAEQARRGGSPPYRQQEPLRTLHFELPRVEGTPPAGSLSPLQGSTRAGSSIGQAVLQSVLKTVLGADAASAFLSGSPAAAEASAPPRMGMPGAPVSAAPRVTGGVTGGITRAPEELNIPPFGGTPAPRPPTVTPAGGDVPPDGTTPIRYLGPGESDSTPTAPDSSPSAPDFGRGPDTFSGGMDRENRMNGRPAYFLDKYADY